jgi:hypothetical protein
MVRKFRWMAVMTAELFVPNAGVQIIANVGRPTEFYWIP